jgi:hypothetical protein
MTLFAGIDEAGYGPTLGPLVSTCVIIECADADLWKATESARPGESRGKEKGGEAPPFVIGDSKAIYPGRNGFKRLEAAALAFLASATGKVPISGEDFLSAICVTPPETSLSGQFWYQPSGETWPLANDLSEILSATDRLRKTSQINALHVVALRSELLTAKEFNRRCETGNKADVLWGLVRDHISFASGLAAGRRLEVTADALGGRRYYAPLLREIFPDARLYVAEETNRASEYGIVNKSEKEVALSIAFRPKADRDYFAPALAGMASKYVRELLMARLNRAFVSHQPGLRQTAGYPVDALRFLSETAALRARLGVLGEDFVRRR